MKIQKFNIGQIYSKKGTNNQYMFKGMLRNDFLFWYRSNENEAWQNLLILPGMNDILLNLE
jgi:hypothetical protein